MKEKKKLKKRLVNQVQAMNKTAQRKHTHAEVLATFIFYMFFTNASFSVVDMNRGDVLYLIKPLEQRRNKLEEKR